MKRSEHVTRWMLFVIAVLALVAIVLQVMNEKTGLVETTYEIITFSVALIAVILAVLQGLANAKTTRELTKIDKEIRELMSDIKRDERRDVMLKNEIKRDLELDRQAIDMIQKVDDES